MMGVIMHAAMLMVDGPVRRGVLVEERGVRRTDVREDDAGDE